MTPTTATNTWDNNESSSIIQSKNRRHADISLSRASRLLLQQYKLIA